MCSWFDVNAQHSKVKTGNHGSVVLTTIADLLNGSLITLDKEAKTK